MLMFVVGGVSGIINASLTLNVALHNTSWIPAHFHMTLAGAVTMTFIGILYWLLPMIRGRALYSTKVALWQIYTWFVGMLIFGYTYGEAGILGVPRRTDLGSASYVNAEAVPYLNGAAIGGVLLLISSSLLFVNILGTLFLSKEPVSGEAPIDTHVESKSPMILERWGFWLIVVLVLVVLAWGPVFLETVNFTSGFNVQGFKPEAPIPLP
jgi:cytochrome c oxidase subunit 1